MNWPKKLRSLLILGRISNLPTVWSNCLAGWLLGGGGSVERLTWVMAGGSCIYIFGMYLNDAMDADFDRQHRKERPIPSSAISAAAVWLWAVGWLGLGLLLLWPLGPVVRWLAAALVACVVIYDAVHKAIAFSPVIMALCRFFLLLLGASVGVAGVTGLALWSACALAAYILGLSYIARKESLRGPLEFWPAVLLAGPVLLALCVNSGDWRIRAWIIAAVLVAWIWRCLRFSFWTRQRNVGLTVSGLLAGIVIVDLLAVAGGSPAAGALFVLFFLAALVLQRYVPAT